MTEARNQLIEATCELLEMQGYHATGLNQIINQSGSPKGSLYYYFPGGKDDLTAQALRHTSHIILQHIEAHLAATANPAEAIYNFIMFVARGVVASGFRTGGPITTVALETAVTNESLSKECALIYQSWQTAFVTKLRQGGFTNEQAEGLGPTIIASIEGGIILSRTYKNVEPLETVAKQIRILIAATR